MNTEKELKNILATSEFIFDNYEDADNYYNIVSTENVKELNRIYTRFYMDGEYNTVVVPLGVACEFFEDLDYSENYENVKDLNPDNLIMINFNDNYIYTDEDIKEFKNDIENYKKSLDKQK